MRGARSFDLRFGLLEVIHPHAKMHHAIVGVFDPRHLAALGEQRDVHGAVGHVDAVLRVASVRHTEGFLEEFLCCRDIRYRQCDVPQFVGLLFHMGFPG